MNFFDGVVQAVVGVVGGGTIVGVVQALIGRKKSTAEAESISIATANGLMVTMRADLEATRTRMTTLEDERSKDRAEFDRRITHAEHVVDSYRRRVEYLTGLLQRNGIEVAEWNPPH